MVTAGKIYISLTKVKRNVKLQNKATQMMAEYEEKSVLLC